MGRVPVSEGVGVNGVDTELCLRNSVVRGCGNTDTVQAVGQVGTACIRSARKGSWEKGIDTHLALASPASCSSRGPARGWLYAVELW